MVVVCRVGSVNNGRGSCKPDFVLLICSSGSCTWFLGHNRTQIKQETEYIIGSEIFCASEHHSIKTTTWSQLKQGQLAPNFLFLP